MKQTLTKLKGEIGSYTIIVRVQCYTSIVNKTSRQKFNKETADLNNTKLT